MNCEPGTRASQRRRGTSRMRDNRTNPVYPASSPSWRVKTRRHSFGRRNRRSISLRRLCFSRSHSRGSGSFPDLFGGTTGSTPGCMTGLRVSSPPQGRPIACGPAFPLSPVASGRTSTEVSSGRRNSTSKGIAPRLRNSSNAASSVPFFTIGLIGTWTVFRFPNRSGRRLRLQPFSATCSTASSACRLEQRTFPHCVGENMGNAGKIVSVISWSNHDTESDPLHRQAPISRRSGVPTMSAERGAHHPDRDERANPHPDSTTSRKPEE